MSVNFMIYLYYRTATEPGSSVTTTRSSTPSISDNTTVEDLKLQAMVDFGIEPEFQRLVLRDRSLNVELVDNNATVRSYGVIRLDRIYVENVLDDPPPTAATAAGAGVAMGVPIDNYTTAITLVTDTTTGGGGGGGLRPPTPPAHLAGATATSTTTAAGAHTVTSTYTGPKETFVGLENQGATCYLNSLIQTLFLTREFREFIFRYPSNRYDDVVGEADAAAATDATAGDGADDGSSGAMKSPTAADEAHAEAKAAAQASGADAAAAAEPADGDAVAPKKMAKRDDIMYQLQMLFAALQLKRHRIASTSALTTSFGWNETETFTQQDVQELNRVLMDNIETKAAGKTIDAMSISDMYRGKMCRVIKCLKCGRESRRPELFYDILLPVKGFKTLDAALATTTAVERLDGSNALFCSDCDSKQDSEISLRFEEAPMFLTIALQRWEFDWNRNVRVKINEDIAVPEFLQLDKYMTDPPTGDKHRQYTGDLSTVALRQCGKRLIPGTAGPVYELFALLVHSGSAGFGHYYSFIKSFTDGQWYKFNDSSVVHVEADSIARTSYRMFQHRVGDSLLEVPCAPVYTNPLSLSTSANPYCLLYRRMQSQVVMTFSPDDFVPRAPASSDEPAPLPAEAGTAASGVALPTLDQLAEADRPTHLLLVDEYKFPPITIDDIPEHVRRDSVAAVEKSEAERREKDRLDIVVHRNMRSLKPLEITMDKGETLQQLMDEIRAQLIKTEYNGDEKLLPELALRRIRSPYGAKRPSLRFSKGDFTRSLDMAGLSYNANVYLEQATPDEPIGPDSYETIFLTVRYFDRIKRELVDLGDITVNRRDRIDDVLDRLHSIHLIERDVPRKELIIAQEVAADSFSVYYPPFSSFLYYNFYDGDILNIEWGCEENKPDSHVHASQTKNYYDTQIDNITILLTETEGSFFHRSPDDADADASAADDADAAVAASGRFEFKVPTRRTHTVPQLKEALGELCGVDPQRLRISIPLTGSSTVREARVLKDTDETLGKQLAKSYGSTEVHDLLEFEVLDEPETLTRDHRCYGVQVYDKNGKLIDVSTLVLMQSQTIYELKKLVEKRTGIPVERQALLEWFDKRFFKIFRFNSLSIAAERILESDKLRVYELESEEMDFTRYSAVKESPYVAVTLVEFVTWSARHYSRMAETTNPVFKVVRRDTTIRDLRAMIAASDPRLDAEKMTLGISPTYPVYEIDMRYVGDDIARRDIQRNAPPIPPEVLAEAQAALARPSASTASTTSTSSTSGASAATTTTTTAAAEAVAAATTTAAATSAVAATSTTATTTTPSTTTATTTTTAAGVQPGDDDAPSSPKSAEGVYGPVRADSADSADDLEMGVVERMPDDYNDDDGTAMDTDPYDAGMLMGLGPVLPPVTHVSTGPTAAELAVLKGPVGEQRVVNQLNFFNMTRDLFVVMYFDDTSSHVVEAKQKATVETGVKIRN